METSLSLTQYDSCSTSLGYDVWNVDYKIEQLSGLILTHSSHNFISFIPPEMKPYCHPMIPKLLLSFLVSLYFCPSVTPVLAQSNVQRIIRCRDLERQALLNFKHGITLDFCGLLTSWGRNDECCQWGGVQCSNNTGHVIALRLYGNVDSHCLEGKVSPSLVELNHLRHLDLSFNLFDEPIPGFLGSLPNLEYLNLSSGTFVGQIPHQLGNLSNLKTLDLSHCYTDSNPGLEWLPRLTSLRYLDLSDADLSKATNWMQIVSNLPFLTHLRMNVCNLPAKIPSSLTYINSSATLHSISLSGNNFKDTSIFKWLFGFPGIKTQLVHLDLSNSEIGGPIPADTFTHMQHLSYLGLSENSLQLPASSKLSWSMPTLSYLDLHSNNFNGNFSNCFRDLCSLETVNLGYNNFTDDLTDLFQTLFGCAGQVLVTLDLSNNSFTGSIPDSIGSFSSLSKLHLHNNQLNGDISRAIGHLSKLQIFDISYNSLQGSLTSKYFSNLSSLQVLYLEANSGLVINISASWVPPFQLGTLTLRSCNLSPGFPKWIQTQKNLTYLDISNAQISDIVPASFWSSLSPHLNYLNMSHNQISGVIPNVSVIFDELYEVDLSSNLFEGAIPSWLTNTFSILYLNDNRFSDSSTILCPKTASYLQYLDLSNNLLSGELPDHCWMNSDGLISLHLENNKLHGSIPKSIGNLNQLLFLHLYNNSFSGALPTSLENCTSLIVLDLGYNSFTGYLPPWIGHIFPNLGALSLRRNMFFGELSLSICQLSHLQILDLSLNNISGVIPKCIHNLTALREKTESTLDAHTETYNPFIGEYSLTNPETEMVTWKREEQRFGKSLGLVKSIDLSDNELHGEIPHGIASLTGLVALDLSGNKLSRSLPSEIGNLTSLEFLDFSNNHLSGEIPASLAEVSSLGTLDLSNNNLSGEIPHSTQLQGFNVSSYTGNLALCGAPLPGCPKDQAPSNPPNGVNQTNEHDEYGVFPGLYISVVLGFIIGFWGVCGTLVIKQSWRHAYFRLVQDIQDWFYEIGTVIAAKTWRKP